MLKKNVQVATQAVTQMNYYEWQIFKAAVDQSFTKKALNNVVEGQDVNEKIIESMQSSPVTRRLFEAD
ncbi:hypothetical protein [Secundilactobacillus kimchicus]|uniref:hypothetical protein n=1 Tax=Secundilactobacillus kimchicus TaxID=528209 RepID=UPI0024A7E08A|nr:hypothetical protein [Secundilactobacillus kimchicus]